MSIKTPILDFWYGQSRYSENYIVEIRLYCKSSEATVKWADNIGSRPATVATVRSNTPTSPLASDISESVAYLAKQWEAWAKSKSVDVRIHPTICHSEDKL